MATGKEGSGASIDVLMNSLQLLQMTRRGRYIMILHMSCVRLVAVV
jgi:hypothetical protein